jgi:Rod binding domain-containing protein
MILYVNPERPALHTHDADAFSTARRKLALEEMEHFFAYTLLHEMRKTIPQGGLFARNQAQEMHEEMFDDALSGAMAKGGHLGIARMLEEQLRIAEMQPKLRTAIEARRVAASKERGPHELHPTSGIKERSATADDLAESAGGIAS